MPATAAFPSRARRLVAAFDAEGVHHAHHVADQVSVTVYWSMALGMDVSP